MPTNPKPGDNLCYSPNKPWPGTKTRQYCVCLSIRDLEAVFHCVADCLYALAQARAKQQRRVMAKRRPKAKRRARRA